MTIHFFLRFHTEAGQEIFISGSNDTLGNYEAKQAVRMSYFNNDYWHISIDFPEGFDDTILYTYFVKYSDATEVYDGENNRIINPENFEGRNVIIYDSWNATGDVNNIFFTNPFRKIFLAPPAKTKAIVPKNLHTSSGLNQHCCKAMRLYACVAPRIL